MRKLLLSVAAASALALSSAAGAAITVGAGTVTGLNNPNPSAAGSIQTVGNTTTINFGQNPVGESFTASFTVHNDLAGLYSIVLSTSTPGVAFTSASFNGTALTPFPDNQNLRLIPPQSLAVGDFIFTLAGTSASGSGSFTGNVTITPVPEPATWAMMIVGFGAMGFAMRRRRRPALAQVA